MFERSSRPMPPAQAISAYRDALLRDASADELNRLAARLDPDIVAWLELFRASQLEAIRLDPSFMHRLDRVIAVAPGPDPTQPELAGLGRLHVGRSHALNGRLPSAGAQSAPRHPTRASWFAAWPQPAAQVAAAFLLVMLLLGSAWAVLYPLRLWDAARLPIFAVQETPPPAVAPQAPGDADGTILLDLVLPDLPAARIEGGVGLTDYPPGGGSQERATTSAEVLYIAAGPMQVAVTTAPQPVDIIPPGATAPDPAMALAKGDEATLDTGTTVVAHPQTVLELLNTSSARARMLDLIWITPSTSTERNGANWTKGYGPPLETASPVGVTLRQVTLAPNTTLAAPATDEASLAAVALDQDRTLDLRFLPDGGCRNGGDAPLDVYALTLTNNAQSPANTGDAGGLEFLWKSEGGSEKLSRPSGLGVDPQGNIWVSDAINDRLQILALDGRRLKTWGTPGDGEGQFEFFSQQSMYGAPYGDVAFDASGNAYVVDTGNFRVQKFAPARTFLLAWGSEGEEDGQFLAASSIAIGPDGIVSVGDETQGDIQAFDTDGRFQRVIGGAESRRGRTWRSRRHRRRDRRQPLGGGLPQQPHRSLQPVQRTEVLMGRPRCRGRRQHPAPGLHGERAISDQDGGVGSANPQQFSDAVAVAAAEDGIVYVTDDPGVQTFRFTLPDGE